MNQWINEWCLRPQFWTVKLHWADETWVNEMYLRPWFCTCKVILGRGQPGLIRWILLWIMPLVQDRSLNLLTCSPARYHCATDAPCLHDPNLLTSNQWECSIDLLDFCVNFNSTYLDCTCTYACVTYITRYLSQYNMHKSEFCVNFILDMIWRDILVGCSWKADKIYYECCRNYQYINKFRSDI